MTVLRFFVFSIFSVFPFFSNFFFLFSTTCWFLTKQNTRPKSQKSSRKKTGLLCSSQVAAIHSLLYPSLSAAPPSSPPTMCDDSCSRAGTRRCYRHSSSADRWEARSRLRPTAYTSARGGSRISRRHVSRSRMSVISGDSAVGDGNRGVHQALCGGIVVSGWPATPRLGRVCGACPSFLLRLRVCLWLFLVLKQ